MKTLSRFVSKFTSLIVTVLSCFDRVIFKGYLPITNGPALRLRRLRPLKIRRCDFMAFAEEQSKTLVDFASRDWPKRPAPEYRFLQGYHHRDKLVEDTATSPSSRWADHVLTAWRLAHSFKLVYGKGARVDQRTPTPAACSISTSWITR